MMRRLLDRLSSSMVTGLMLVVVTALVPLGLLAWLAPAAEEGWIVSLDLLLAGGLVALYVVLVVRPQRAAATGVAAREVRHHEQNAAIATVLGQLRGGDLVAAAAPSSALEDALRDAVTAALRSLSALIQQILSSSVEVAMGARTVQETAAELASGSSQQAAAVVQITSTMEELARTAGQIASNASNQAEQAAQAEQSGDIGAMAVEAAVQGVEAVRQRIEVIASRTDALGTRSREIYRILDLINEIAQETHILSLNAAIEASAAGEHGQRFSVVAEEVRRLAERSRESVQSVRSLLEEFAASIRATVVATEEGSKAAAEVLEQSRSAASAIEELRGALTDTARAAREISLATDEQRTASDQVVLTLKEVSEVIQRMADGLKHFSGTAERLNELGLSIQLLSQSFRLESSRSLKHQVQRWAERLGDVVDNPEAVEARLDEVVRNSPYLELVYLVNDEGTMVGFVVNRELVGDREPPSTVAVGQAYADRPWYQAVVRDGRSTVTPVYESLLTGEECFTIAAPVEIHGGRRGVVGADVNVRHWTRI